MRIVVVSSLLAINVQYNQSERQQWSEGINKESSEILIIKCHEVSEVANRDVRDLKLRLDVKLQNILTLFVKLKFMHLIEELMAEIHSIKLSFGEPGIAPITVAICEKVCTYSVD